ncbi:putative Gramicidin S biosynthesis protein GrsT [Blattamonas nauphoetae]|uniref:Gramicidin S biosynthesis protein GrsT n=1 Tax=Blattamonas nauphoetae TaxID=2049346 RepID=A0ABQ9WWX6_9EUKA|nr:putative Gramicidin S biosynthesis protein GrsT [Blattamonas nauphoetae]
MPRPESNGVPTTLRLFCFNHAGGSPTVFNTRWAKFLPAEVQVVGIQFPGRMSRVGEPGFKDAKIAMKNLIDEIAFMFEEPEYLPYSAYGHSFGACCALEFCRQIRNRGWNPPITLICSSRLPPQMGVVDPPIFKLPDDELQQQLLLRYDTPLITDPDTINLTLPPMRDDLEALDGYLPDPYDEVDVPLSCPLTVFVGELDKMVPFSKLDRWQEHTTSAFQKSLVKNAPHFMWEDKGYKQTLKRAVQEALDIVGEKGEQVTWVKRFPTIDEKRKEYERTKAIEAEKQKNEPKPETVEKSAAQPAPSEAKTKQSKADLEETFYFC